MENYLAEAFQKLSLLKEDDFDITADRDVVDELKSFVADDVEEIPEEPVIDLDAESEEDLADNYVGKVILECACCHTRIYKDEAEVVVDEESGLANVEEACPVCNNVMGYTVIGKIEKFDEEEPEAEEADDTVDFSDAENDPAPEAPVESLKDRLRKKRTALKEGKDVCPKCGKNPCECDGNKSKKAKAASKAKGLDAIRKIYGNKADESLKEGWDDWDDDYDDYCYKALNDFVDKVDPELLQNKIQSAGNEDKLAAWLCDRVFQDDYYGAEQEMSRACYDVAYKLMYGDDTDESLQEGVGLAGAALGAVVGNLTKLGTGKGAILGAVTGKALEMLSNSKLASNVKDALEGQLKKGQWEELRNVTCPNCGKDGTLLKKKKSSDILCDYCGQSYKLDNQDLKKSKSFAEAYDLTEFFGEPLKESFENQLSRSLIKEGFGATISAILADPAKMAALSTLLGMTIDAIKQLEETELAKLLRDWLRNLGKTKGGAKEAPKTESLKEDLDPEVRCQDCAYLVEGEDGSWICDIDGADIHTITECPVGNTGSEFGESLNEKLYPEYIDYFKNNYDPHYKDMVLQNIDLEHSTMVPTTPEEAKKLRNARTMWNSDFVVGKCNGVICAPYALVSDKVLQKLGMTPDEFVDNAEELYIVNRKANDIKFYRDMAKSSDKSAAEYDDQARAKRIEAAKHRAMAAKIKAGYDESLTEGIENLSMDTDDTHVEMSSTPDGGATVTVEPKAADEFPPDDADTLGPGFETGEEEIVPLSDEEQEEILANEPEGEETDLEFEEEPLGDEELLADEEPVEGEEEVADEEEEEEELPEESLKTTGKSVNEDLDAEDDGIDIDEFDEDKFNDLCESYLRKVYENVNTFNTTTIQDLGNKLIVEGTILFKNKKQMKSRFVFTEANETKSGKVVLAGYNETFSKQPKSFKLKGTLKNNNYVAESMAYRYTVKNLNEGKAEKTKVLGKVKTKK